MKNHSFIKVTMLAILIIRVSTTYFYFASTLMCAEPEQSYCKKWVETFEIQRGGFLFSEPFLGNISIQTPSGLKLISDLEQGEKILSYNTYTGQNQFAIMSTWLHIDQQAHMDFLQIKTKQGPIYILSNKTNIAIKTNEENLKFLFAQNLQKQETILFGGKTLTVQSISTVKQKQGLFLPYVEGGNFYIYPSNTKDKDSMVLIHCFGNVQNPQKHHTWIYPLVKILNNFQFDIQKVQFYQHPIGNIIYLLGQPSENTRIFRGGSHGSSHSSSHSYHSSTSTNHNRQVQRRKKQLVAVLSMKQMFNIVVYNG